MIYLPSYEYRNSRGQESRELSDNGRSKSSGGHVVADMPRERALLPDQTLPLVSTGSLNLKAHRSCHNSHHRSFAVLSKDDGGEVRFGIPHGKVPPALIPYVMMYPCPIPPCHRFTLRVYEHFRYLMIVILLSKNLGRLQLRCGEVKFAYARGRTMFMSATKTILIMRMIGTRMEAFTELMHTCFLFLQDDPA